MGGTGVKYDNKDHHDSGKLSQISHEYEHEVKKTLLLDIGIIQYY